MLLLLTAFFTWSIMQVEDALYSRVDPTPTGTEPYLVAYSREVAGLLDLEPAECERCVQQHMG